MAINPVASADAFAEETTSKNYDLATAADANVTISFTPMSGSASLTPTTSDGASAKIDVTANIKIASTGGYSIYLGGENAALTGTKTGTTIPGATTATTFNNMKTNTWGYTYAEGTSVADSATYSALPQGQGKILESVSGNNTNIDKTYALSFATKIGNDKPADVYENQITLSVTSSPLQITWDTMTELQQMTSEICSKAASGATKQLQDVRDGKYYWVSKLQDGKCWMTQNLDLDLVASTLPLTSATSDVGSDWYPRDNNTGDVRYTAARADSSTIFDSSTGQRSWSLGDYRITNPTTISYCGSNKSDASQCSGQFTAYTTPTAPNGSTEAHYILGNHYQWNTATAGTGIGMENGQAPSSICPKNWRLPTSRGTNEDYNVLVASLSGSSVNEKRTAITSSPYYFVMGGDVVQKSDKRFDDAGAMGNYWSSIIKTNEYGTFSFNLNFYSSEVNPQNGRDLQNGFSVRCVAR